MATRFEQFITRGLVKYGPVFQWPEGQDFIDAYNKGQNFRIKVVSVFDGKQVFPRWGYIGFTTGWKPAFLLMRRLGQTASSDLLNPHVDKVVETKWHKPRKRRK